MEALKIILWILLGLFLLMVIYSLFVYFLVAKAIQKRSDKNPLLEYYTSIDYPTLKATPLSFKSKEGVNLNGFHYAPFESGDSEYLLLFFHGIGSGHEAYTTLINDLVTELKTPLIAFDYTGCDLSEGSKIPNTLQALSDGEELLKYLNTSEYTNKKLILVGHSWGGFVASNLSKFDVDKKVVGVVSLNGITDFAATYRRITYAPKIFIPLYNLLTAIHYKKLAFMNTEKSTKNTEIPHLFVHGLHDAAVPFKEFIAPLMFQSLNNKNIFFHIEQAKFHNAYLTVESETNLQILQKDLQELGKKKSDEELISAKIKNTDFDHLVENDPVVITVIKKFVEENIWKKS